MIIECELFFVSPEGPSGVETLYDVLKERGDRSAVAVQYQIQLEVVGVLRCGLLVLSGDLDEEGEWQVDFGDRSALQTAAS